MIPTTTYATVAVAFLLGALTGAWIAFTARRRGNERQLLAATGRVSAAEATVRSEAERRRALEAELDETEATARRLDRELAVAEERARVYDDARRALENTFEALANKALRGNAEQFFTLARERLTATSEAANADLEKRQQSIQALLDPLRESLERLATKTDEVERSRVNAYSRIDEQVRLLSRATTRLDEKATSLSTALRGPTVQGRWGEMALRNVAELAGMTEHCDFEEQRSLLEGRRPDMTVFLPGGRRIAVDAKAPLAAYLEASEAATDDQRSAALDRHVKALRAHVRSLADRGYAEAMEGDFDLVVLFLPGDPFLAAAFARDPDLQVEALRSKVLIATPTTLVALLRTVAIYWQQSAVVENAELIAAAARDLYERAAKFGSELARMGRGLRTALDAYNTAVGSFDRRLMPMGRRLEEMSITGQSKRRLERPEPIEETVRTSTEADPDDEPPPN